MARGRPAVHIVGVAGSVGGGHGAQPDAVPAGAARRGESRSSRQSDPPSLPPRTLALLIVVVQHAFLLLA